MRRIKNFAPLAEANRIKELAGAEIRCECPPKISAVERLIRSLSTPQLNLRGGSAPVMDKPTAVADVIQNHPRESAKSRV
jgi:hypothetical protein